jgi:opacity protein-like surface antigen
MAKFYSSIGKQVTDFFKSKTYNLDRKVVLNVRDDPVNWKLDNTFDNDGTLQQSSLSVSHKLAQEKLTLKTMTNKNPEFSITTQRVNNIEGTLRVQDPKVNLEIEGSINDNIGYCVENTFNWSQNKSGNKSEIDLSVAYNYDQFTFGAAGTIPFNNDFSLNSENLDYNIGVEYNRNNNDQIFSINTKNRFSKINIGALFKYKSVNNGYCRLELQQNKNNDGKISVNYNVGLSRDLTSNSTFGVLYRSDLTGSLFYNTKLNDNNLKANVAFNYNFSKPNPNDRCQLQYKLTFG